MATALSLFNGFKSIGYFTSWSIYNNYTPDMIPGENLTHLYYAFANIRDGEIAIGDSYADIEKQFDGKNNTFNGIHGNFGYLNSENGDFRKKYSHIKTMIAVGGWSWSKDFSIVARTVESRKKFTDSVVEFVTKYNFDGIEIDWEYPVSGGEPGNSYHEDDGKNFVKLVRLLSYKFKKYAYEKQICKRYQIGVAVSASKYTADNTDIKKLSKYVDIINIMAYDFSGSWLSETRYHANLYEDINNISEISANSSLHYYLEKVQDKKKLVLGCPFYARSFSSLKIAANDTSNGFNVQFNSVPNKGDIPKVQEGGAISYKDLYEYTLEGNSKEFESYYDDSAKAPYLYSKKNKMWVSYENNVSLKAKLDYIKQMDIGGVMVWELSQDYNNSLISEIGLAMKQAK
ncbi:hypothetical protein BB559_004470 [Furculomyces boomerangus]|uniref:GH18 domain-containing protein n=3 Tax=Harpellales TaxID=61421 RepID=A0A2T9Y8G2_9FUNG|nr:hypothetical protein BB559_005461 [Furculomyces boomerangus]PVU90722.1 hypothetical protein BB559_004470 [Furculomyces boomerangus]PWA00075.1 hypothetical protein BB558_003921 [Smittium angustum]